MSSKPRNASLPEVWKTRDGRTLLIREMSDMHLHNAIAMLRKKGCVSLRDWQDARPTFPCGLMGEYAQDAAEQAFLEAMDSWATTRFHPAIDAMHLELSFRRRHGIEVAEARVDFKEQVDPAPEAPSLGWPEEAAPDVWRECDGEPRVGDVVARPEDTDYEKMPVVESVGLKEGRAVVVVLRHGTITSTGMTAALFKKTHRLISRHG